MKGMPQLILSPHLFVAVPQTSLRYAMGIKMQGEFFDEKLQEEIRDKFFFLDQDPSHEKRIFFENAGGSLRLKKCVKAKAEYEKYPDCPERIHDTALMLKSIQAKGTEDIMKVIFGAESGVLMTELTASQTMFYMVGVISHLISGTNIVTSVLEHPSAYDAAGYYAQKTGKELRVARANQKTGGIDVEEITKLIDKDTCLLSIMYASNITGSIMDIENIVKETRKIKPDLYILVDAVQHAPHGVMDVEKLQVDGMNFAPYKAFGIRGCGFAYLSDRLARLRHRKLLDKSETVWELGTPAPANFAAAIEIVNYICWIGIHYTNSNDRRTQYVTGMEHIHLQERALLDRMLNGSENAVGLRGLDKLNLYLDYEDLTKRDLIICMDISGLDYTQTVREYAKRGVTVYERVHTSAYSKRMLEAFGLEGAIRVSPIHCHNKKDVDDFLIITKEIADECIK